MMIAPELPVAVIGAGPVGLAAAAHLVSRGIRPLIFERGHEPGAAMRDWAHVRVFSPWRYNIDAAARSLLEAAGWREPDPDHLPTGGEIIDEYLAPLAAVPGIAPNLRLGAEVTGITREGMDKMSSKGRDTAPLIVQYVDGQGGEQRARVKAIIDASGTWTKPNPAGVDGLPVPGERASADRITYGIPDVVGAERAHFAGKRTLVIGGGHSAINVALALMELQQQDEATEIFWALRHASIDRLVGGGLNDQLPERGALGLAAKAAMDDGRLKMLTAFSMQRIERREDGLRISARRDGGEFELNVDRIVVAAGFRPDLSFLGELRVSLDPAVEAPHALAALIDPNFHSCGTVPPHGIAELRHPEPGFAIVGSKSYGRAPTFLMTTGYEQVRSVVAAIAGDEKAAREVHLVLPETGVCSVPVAISGVGDSGCCGGPAPAEVDACCVADAMAKDEGKPGCGCGSNLRTTKAEAPA
jgi:hypothetical protein